MPDICLYNVENMLIIGWFCIDYWRFCVRGAGIGRKNLYLAVIPCFLLLFSARNVDLY